MKRCGYIPIDYRGGCFKHEPKWYTILDPEFWMERVSLDTFNGMYKRLTEIREKLQEMIADALSGKVKGVDIDPSKELRLIFD